MTCCKDFLEFSQIGSMQMIDGKWKMEVLIFNNNDRESINHYYYPYSKYEKEALTLKDGFGLKNTTLNYCPFCGTKLDKN